MFTMRQVVSCPFFGLIAVYVLRAWVLTDRHDLVACA